MRASYRVLVTLSLLLFSGVVSAQAKWDVSGGDGVCYRGLFTDMCVMAGFAGWNQAAVRCVISYDPYELAGQHSSCGCEDYDAAIPGACGSCPEGTTLNAGSGTCDPPAPPECAEDEIAVGQSCAHPYDPDDTCYDVEGYVNGVRICNDDKNECEASGGTYGGIGTGNDPVQAVCLPDDYEEQLPTCAAGTDYYSADGQGFACTSVGDAPDGQDNIQQEETDTDGDGTPDSQDSDIDGDGTPNSTDPDIDGDGIDNADDPTPNGQQEQKTSGGGGCGSAPSCSGDPIQCAILYQTWKGRCAAEGENSGVSVTGGGTCEKAPSCKGDPIQCAMLTQQWEARCFSESIGDLTEADVAGSSDVTGNDPSGLDLGDTDLTTVLNGIYDTPGAAGSCPSPQQINVAGLALDIPYTAMCDFAGLIRPVLLFFFGLLSFRIVMRAF